MVTLLLSSIGIGLATVRAARQSRVSILILRVSYNVPLRPIL